MKLVDFWTCLPGEWLFERNISNGLHQTGVLKVEEIDSTLCQAHETGRYTDSHQVFFRNYRFEWANDSLNIFGENPKEGFVLLHELSDAKKRHVHKCNKDFYEFELHEVGEQRWHTVITITGPKKALQLVTEYKR